MLGKIFLEGKDLLINQTFILFTYGSKMKIEIEKSEYDRLKSREEKYLAYMDMLSYRGEDETYVDALCGKVTELEEENKKLKEENEILKEYKLMYEGLIIN